MVLNTSRVDKGNFIDRFYSLVATAHPDLSTSTANKKWFEALSEVDGIITRDLTAVGGDEM